MKNGVGIRPMGMGGAFTAVADDVNAVFYNPAGLAGQTFSLSLANYNLNKPAYNNGTSGFLNVGSLGYGWWGYSTASNDALSVNALSYAQRAAHGFQWGLTYKQVRSKVGAGDNSTWSSDAGFLIYVTPWLNLGFLAQDFVRNQDVPVGGSSRFGVAIAPPKSNLVLSADIENDSTRAGENLLHYGLEFSALDGLKLRLGSDRGRTTAGLGFAIGFLTIDYAFIADPAALDYQQCAAISMGIPKLHDRSFSILRPKEYAVVEVRSGMVGGLSQLSLFGGLRQGVDDLILDIRRASYDPSIDGIILKIGGFPGGLGGLAMAQEIRSELKAAKARGKKIIAYVQESAWGEEYYLAASADKIVAPAGASIGGIGQMIAIPRAKELFDKFGVEWELWSTGDYKDTFFFSKAGLSKPQRAMLEDIVEDLYRQMVTDISFDRNISIEKVKQIADGRLITVFQAKEMGLVDEIGYLNDAASLGNELCGGSSEEAKLIPVSAIQADLPKNYLFAVFNRVAVVSVNGELVSGDSAQNMLMGGVYTGADSITEQLRKATDDPQIKAIILRINSPGGSVVGAGQIYEEVLRAKSKGKVVVASLGDIAASAGYYIAAPANKIVADPATITGSIGVIGAFPVLQKLYKMLGISVDTVQEGKHMDMFSGQRKLSDEEKNTLNRLMDESYQDFINCVAESRNLPPEDVAKKAGGKLYTGSQAKEQGLVDMVGGFSDAVELAKSLSGMQGEPELVFYDSQWGFWKSGPWRFENGTPQQGNSPFHFPFFTP